LLALFRLNDPYRLILIFFVLLGFRLPFMISPELLTIPELNYMLVGEKMSGGATLYDGIWDNIAPLSAGVYMIIDFLFGRSQNAYLWGSLFVTFFQCYLFNKLVLDNKAYNENTYVPGLIYGVFMSLFFDFLTLSPVLIGQTFLLMALNNIFSHIEFRAKRDEKILNIGIYLGLAALFYLPFIIFGVATLLIFMFFTGTVGRRYMLMFFGFLLPLLITGTYFLVEGRIFDFIYSFIDPLIALNKVVYLDFKSTLILFAAPVLFLIVAFFKILQKGRFNNYQARLTQVMFVWMVFAMLFVLLATQHSPSIYMVFVPALAFYICHYLLVIRNRILAEIALLIILTLTILLNHGTRYDFFITRKLVNLENYLVKEGDEKLKDKKVLILDNNLEPYINCQHATPFLDWSIVEELFTNLDYYDNQVTIYNGFKNDMPDIILDPKGVMPDLFDKIPVLAANYKKENGRYLLIN